MSPRRSIPCWLPSLLGVGLIATGAAANDFEFFEKRVRPLLVEKCHS
jgi:hypothetical protein